MKAAKKRPTFALVGNPNCGKTSLFNALTGAWQRVGNWSGVTVERKGGTFVHQKHAIDVVDLPGTYTLTTFASGPEDEIITAQSLKTGEFDAVVNVVDALNLERNLYLTIQLLEMGLPVIVALNRIDLAEKEGRQIDTKRLSAQLGCPVVSLSARQGFGVDTLKDHMVASPDAVSFDKVAYPAVLEAQLTALKAAHSQTIQSETVPQYQWIRWLEGESLPCSELFSKHMEEAQHTIARSCKQEADVVIASARYAFIEETVRQSRRLIPQKQKRFSTEQIDKLVCHRTLGLPIFLGVMYALFFFAINVGGAFQDFFELSAEAFFVDGMGALLGAIGAPLWLTTPLVLGVGKGVSTVLTFVPVIGAMFLALAFLEDCGYMARAAFVVDRLMRMLGLPGKSFVPLIVGFGCNVPAIMGTRSLDFKRDRILAVMMSPFMSCGARLAIFTVFVSAFFQEGGQNIVFMLYLIGIGMALLTGWLLKKTLLQGEMSPLVMEMPDYQWPLLRTLAFHSWHRLRRFLVNALKLIVPVCLCIGVLNNINTQGHWVSVPGETSMLSVAGKKVTPLFKPMGMDEENWPAAVGLFTGVLAKEVVIGTLNSLYAEPVLETPLNSVELFNKKLIDAVQSIPHNLSSLGDALIHPLSAKLPEMTFSDSAYGEMVTRFQHGANAFAYLLFVLLYFPCVSATAAMVREVQKGWTLFSVCWTTGLAYLAAVLYYQCATFSLHPLQSLAWSLGSASVGVMFWTGIKAYSRQHLPRRLPTPIVLNSV